MTHDPASVEELVIGELLLTDADHTPNTRSSTFADPHLKADVRQNSFRLPSLTPMAIVPAVFGISAFTLATPSDLSSSDTQRLLIGDLPPEMDPNSWAVA